MVLVAIAAFNCLAIRTVLDYGPIGDRLGIGALPMANILIVVTLVGYPYHASRRFLWGFEAFGATAVVLYAALTILMPSGVPYVSTYNRLAADFLINSTYRAPWSATAPWIHPRLLFGYILLSIWVSVPQLAFALLGGFLSHRFRIR
jgi:hypothetical protein